MHTCSRSARRRPLFEGSAAGSARGTQADRTVSGRSSIWISETLAIWHASSIAFSSSRTFPGQSYRKRQANAWGAYPLHRPLVPSRFALEKIAGQSPEIAEPLAQRWDVQLDDAQAVEQILPKPA